MIEIFSNLKCELFVLCNWHFGVLKLYLPSSYVVIPFVGTKIHLYFKADCSYIRVIYALESLLFTCRHQYEGKTQEKIQQLSI